jgi:serine acetyltransferase
VGRTDTTDERRPGWLKAAVRESHPRFATAVRADVDAALSHRTEPLPRSRAGAIRAALRLAATSDAFLAQCCYRAKAACQRRGVPVLPHVLHRLAITTGQICIGDPVHVEPGVYLPHGQVVVDGFTTIGPGVVITPFVTIGLKAGHPIGPTLERGVHVGTGARIVGPVTIGARARIGANAVVTSDVPAGATSVGVPARVRPPERPGGTSA